MVRPAFARVIALGSCTAALAFATGVTAIRAQSPSTTVQGEPQKPPATFRTGVELVQADVVVLDGKGRFVSDLQAGDFEVFEDGRPQRIFSVRLFNLPIEPAGASPRDAETILGDVVSNEQPFDGRLYIIVLDDLHTAPQRTNVARRLARDFVMRAVSPTDMAAVVMTSGVSWASQDFTGDRARLLQAIDRFVGQKVISPGLTAGAYVGLTPEDTSPDAAGLHRLSNARSSIETLQRLAKYAGTVRNRRKALVLISEGYDYDFGRRTIETSGGTTLSRIDPATGEMIMEHTGGTAPSETAASRQLRDNLIDFSAEANRANAILYALDPRVFTHGGDDLVDIASGIPGFTGSDGSEILKTAPLQNDLRASQDNLRAMAAGTGGFAATGSPRSIEVAVERILVENSNYYMIAYYPESAPRDGKFHRIEVKVKRPGLTVNARPGYTAPKAEQPVEASVKPDDEMSPELREALGSALPVSGLRLRATAAAFRGEASKASVAVLVQAEGRDIEFRRKGDRFDGSLEVVLVALDSRGRQSGGERMEIDMPLNQALHDFVSEKGVVIQARLSLDPGRYRLRIAGRDVGSGRVGSVTTDIDVPDYTGAALSMSDIVLTGELAGLVPCPRADEQLSAVLPATPVPTREFSASDTLTVYAEVYDSNADRQSIHVSTSVALEDGNQRSSRTQPIERGPGQEPGTIRHLTRIPLAGLQPGSYVLRLEALSLGREERPASREIRFRVR